MKRKQLQNEKGFTLIELMIVIAVIGLIGTIIFRNVSGRYSAAQVDATKIQIKQIGTVLDEFRMVCGFYPLTEQGLQALKTKPEGRECKNYRPEGFVDKVPQDAWGNDFEYEATASKYRVCSLGSDATKGGEGDAADFCSDEL